MILSLKQLPNDTLSTAVKALRSKENITQAQIVRYLLEVEERKIYSELGHSSLLTYCIEALGYSVDAAYIRVQAVKCLKENPELFDLIKDGEISLCGASDISKIKIQSVKSEIIQELVGESRDKRILAESLSNAPVKSANKAKRAAKTRNLKESFCEENSNHIPKIVRRISRYEEPRLELTRQEEVQGSYFNAGENRHLESEVPEFNQESNTSIEKSSVVNLKLLCRSNQVFAKSVLGTHAAIDQFSQRLAG